MKLPSDVPGLIQVDNKGYFMLRLEVPTEARAYETYKCELLTRKGMHKKLEELLLTRYVLHNTEDEYDVS